jgi:pyruvate/2-oxoglutarate dehydrogenase complex dihydrolipoamide acyltransferase (E2) component
MILNFKKGSQILGKKIADLDTGEPTQAASLQPAAQPAALQPTPALATPAPAAEPAAPQPGASAPQPSEDWGELLVRLLASAPEEVAQRLVGCLDKEVIIKVLERWSDPHLKVALMLITKK